MSVVILEANNSPFYGDMETYLVLLGSAVIYALAISLITLR